MAGLRSETRSKILRNSLVVLHYTQADLNAIRYLQPVAICHSGGGTDYFKYNVLEHAPYRRMVEECNIPQIGFCGGHQILASFFGSKLGPMRRLRPNEPVLSTYRPGWFLEWGIYPVRILRRDPLFRGCKHKIYVQENHYWEVKKLGTSLVRLAESRDCKVQAFRHRTKPIYGVQFHPEKSPPQFPDGSLILQNFFTLASRLRGVPNSSCRQK